MQKNTMALWVGRGLLILIGAALLYLTITMGQAWLTARQLAEQGLVTEGEILDLEPRSNLGFDSCVISYSYVVGGQGASLATYNATVDANGHFCTVLRVDSKISAHYLPNDYKTTDVVDNSLASSRMWVIGVADVVFFWVLAIFAIWRKRGMKMRDEG